MKAPAAPSPGEQLEEQECVPCNAKTPRLQPDAIESHLSKIKPEWYVADGKMIRRKFKLKDFRENMDFVNRIAKLAEAQGHHPDMCIAWNILEVSLWTHAIGGLSDNDFIMAAKITDLYKKKFGRKAAK